MDYRTKPIESVAAFAEFLRKECTDVGQYLFRGQKRDWGLEPSLFRAKTYGELTIPELEDSLFWQFKRAASALTDFHST